MLHVIDIAETEGRDAYKDFSIVNHELKKYGKSVSGIPQIVVLNKIDAVADKKRITAFKNKLSKLKTKYSVVEISAAARINLEELLKVTAKTLETLPPKKALEFEPFEYARPDANKYEITRADDGAYVVSGGFIDELIRNIVLDDPTSFAYFQKVLKEKGIIKELKKRGAGENSTIRIGSVDFDFVE